LKEKQNRERPVVTYAPAVQNNLRELILDTAEKKIPFQRLASSRVTGTDTDAFAYSNGGVGFALCLACIPLSKWCTVMMLNVIKLIYETILKLENNETFSYFK
jgi:putative aminopeptidase FrvX